MPRPSIAGWFDSEIRVWRASVDTDTLGVESRTYTVIGTYGAAVNRAKMSVGQAAGGLEPIGTLRWYGLPTISVLPRDIAEVITGPDAGHTWEVDQIKVRPRLHHTQVDCVEWHGTLPDLEESS